MKRCARNLPARRTRGFSLVEVAVVLVIVGVAGALLWRVLPQWRPAAEGDRVARGLLVAEQALQGFALASHRLPCPDTSAARDGLEHCDGPSVGSLPVRTLGLPATLAGLRYGVQRGGIADLTQATSRQIPRLPPGMPPPQVVNGLDFCVALQQSAQAASPTPGFSVGGQAAAFALAHPGSEDRDGDGDLFDGDNKATTFAIPGTPASAGYDDRTAAAGFGELAMRLGCLPRLGIANGTARAAYAAWDQDRFAAMYVQFRALALQVREDNTDRAVTLMALAGVDLAIAIATSATGVALAAASAGVGAGTIAGAAAAVIAATANVAASAVSLVSAQEAESVAHQQVGAAAVYKARTAVLLEAARQRAIAVDAEGLQP